MNLSAIFSRRVHDRRVDFRPDMDEGSPSYQARRLSALLNTDKPHVLEDKDITDCAEAIEALREYQYRKLFTGTSHDEFLKLDKECPEHIDWQIRTHEIVSENFRTRK